MAENKKNKMFMILGVLAVAGIAIYMLRKKNQTPTAPPPQARLGDDDVDLDMPDSDAQDLPDEEEMLPQDPSTSTCLRMGGLHDNWVGIQYRSRERANDLVPGSTVTISNTNQQLDGTYNVIDTWIDTNGNVGALDIEHNYTPRLTERNGLERDYNYDGEGLICY